MVQTAANVVERVLPPDVPLRQLVVTFPFELRGRLGFDSKLLSAVSGVVVDSILGFYERRMRDVIGPLPRIACTEPSSQQGIEDIFTCSRWTASSLRSSMACLPSSSSFPI